MKSDTNYDAIIIGSGAGGGASAWALTRQGLKVLLLEAGPSYDPFTDYRLHLDTWEQSRFPHKIPVEGRQSFAPLQQLDDKWKSLYSWDRVKGRKNKTNRRAAWGYHHVVGLGGSTLHFTGEAHRLHPKAMKMATDYGVAADWPLDYAELEPYYLQAERVIGVAGPKQVSGRHRSAPFPLAAHPMGYASQKLGAACKQLGLGWEPNTLATLSAPYDGRPPCNYCANCYRGCPRRDKGSVDVTFIPKAVATGKCDIRSGCQVTCIKAGSNDRVTAVEYVDASGATQSVPARMVIVACGAIETPRLLLNSANQYAQEGLANESGQVGKNFMETLYWTASGLHPEPLGSHRGLPSDAICWDFNAPDAIPGIIGGCRFSSATAEADLVGPINYAQRIVGGWGREHKRQMRELFGRVLSLASIGENLPNQGSFVDLDPDHKDTMGMPKARIHSHLEKGEIKRLAFMANKVREILHAAGVDQLVEEYGAYDAFNSTHVFGTCRMGENPKASVVNRDCRSHRWKNLYVIDSSVFPSSGGGESPSLTIEALAIRAAEIAVSRMRKKNSS